MDLQVFLVFIQWNFFISRQVMIVVIGLGILFVSINVIISIRQKMVWGVWLCVGDVLFIFFGKFSVMKLWFCLVSILISFQLFIIRMILFSSRGLFVSEFFSVMLLCFSFIIFSLQWVRKLILCIDLLISFDLGINEIFVMFILRVWLEKYLLCSIIGFSNCLL